MYDELSNDNMEEETNKETKMRKVLLQGAFDIINWGHVMAFQEAKAQGDYLVVALNTNELLEAYKGKAAVLPWYQKQFIIESFKFVDEVIEAPDFSPMKLLIEHDISVYCLTKEWEHTKLEEIEYMTRKGRKVHFLPRFPGVVPTSEIKRRLLAEEKNM